MHTKVAPITPIKKKQAHRHTHRAVHQACEVCWDAAHDEQRGGDNAGARGVAKGAQEETRDHGGGHGGVVDLVFGHARVPRELGGDEPGYEGHEETEPREGESTHVGWLEAAEPESGGPVLRLGVDGDVIGIICLKRARDVLGDGVRRVFCKRGEGGGGA